VFLFANHPEFSSNQFATCRFDVVHWHIETNQAGVLQLVLVAIRAGQFVCSNVPLQRAISSVLTAAAGSEPTDGKSCYFQALNARMCRSCE
jgi:hypothetical protein